MLSKSDLAAILVLAIGVGALDVARIVQQQQVEPVELWTPAPRQPDPDIEAGRQWLDRKADQRDRDFREQQRQQAEDRRLDRLERRLNADRRLPPEPRQ